MDSFVIVSAKHSVKQDEASTCELLWHRDARLGHLLLHLTAQAWLQQLLVTAACMVTWWQDRSNQGKAKVPEW